MPTAGVAASSSSTITHPNLGHGGGPAVRLWPPDDPRQCGGSWTAWPGHSQMGQHAVGADEPSSARHPRQIKLPPRGQRS